MLAPITHILPLTHIRRTRMLPVPGKLLVRAGQKVTATDVVAEARLNVQHLVLDVSRGLGYPPDQVDQFVNRKVGDEVSQGDVIAGPVGVIHRMVRCPKDGRIVAIGGGQVLVEINNAPYEMQAGISGLVVDLIPDRGVVIETTGVLVQGVWGNQKSDKGILTVIANGPNDPLTSAKLDVSMRGVVALAGPCSKAEALKVAGEIPVRGLILPSITGDLVPIAAQLPIPIVVLEGFGNLPMDRQAYQVLSTNEKREVVVNACALDRLTGERPEVIIPLPAVGQIPTPREADIFAPGQTVRILRAPYTAAIGTLVSLRPGQVIFPSGLRAQSATVRLENGEQVAVPLANLEVIE